MKREEKMERIELLHWESIRTLAAPHQKKLDTPRNIGGRYHQTEMKEKVRKEVKETSCNQTLQQKSHQSNKHQGSLHPLRYPGPFLR